MTTAADKTALRVRMRGLRRRLTESLPDAPEQAARRLPLSRFGRFRVVAGYWSQGSEMNPRAVMEAIRAIDPVKIRLALPAAVDKDSPLAFRLWAPGQPLVPDAYGIPAPPPAAEEVLPNLVIAPLLAFDRKGGRLGQGAGHYDRSLKNLRQLRAVFVLGLAYSGQELDVVPTDAHDQRLDAILTETEYIEAAKGKS
jgi:5-formyltetrahydrofolate cyclo-ligase